MHQDEKDWTNILFLTLTPLVGIGGTALYAARFGVRWWEPALFLLFSALVGLAITGGYHRLYSHRAYECHPAVEVFHLFFGSLALQNSVLNWASDHRDHHRYVDTDRDPYNIRQGFFWAHILWVFYKTPKDRSFASVPDLTRNRLVVLQHRWGTAVGIVAGLGLPTLVGAAFGRPLGGLLWGGFLRIVFVHHTTFFINSLAHFWGAQPYSDENSARDSWLLAFVTNGEGYHNFHHRFAADYRNGISWWHFDPGKWLIRSLEAVGLASSLRRTPTPVIEEARIRMTIKRAETRLASGPSELVLAVRERIANARASLERASALWAEVQARVERARSEYRACLVNARRERRRAARLIARIPAHG